MIRQRKPIPRLSEKRSKSGKPFLKRSAIKRKHRKPSEFRRIYHSKEFVAWIHLQPCSACGVVGYSEAAHVAPASEKGTGYKAGFEWVIPLCRAGPAREIALGTSYVGCHNLYDKYRWLFDGFFPDFDPRAEAARTQKLWKLQDDD